MSSDKKYGLLVPEKAKRPVFQATRNVFGDDSESDEDSNKKPILLRPSENINRQARIAQNKAIIEDPSVFQYDEVYDDMKNEKELKKEKSKESKKPRYIENLLKTANKRKIENERRIERQIQKERETEGDEFADKEVFVTSAYKKKLEELSLEEEKEKREEYLESIGDVTKQRDLGGFYRHLYEQKLGSSKEVDAENASKTIDNKSEIKTEKPTEVPTSASSDRNAAENSKKRNYRKRKVSSENNKPLSEGEVADSDEEINRLNLDDIRMAKQHKQSEENIDADSDFSIDDSSEDEKPDNSKETSDVVFKKPIDKKSVEEESNNGAETKVTLPAASVVTESKPKIDIWKKRTVGELFDQALKRYYERKAARSI